MLFLVGAVVGVFVAQDLILFYAFFEAMLIPLYVLIGVWGGAGRTRATLTFVIYTMAGSLLMLAAIVVFGLRAGHVRPDRLGHERQRLALPRLPRRVPRSRRRCSRSTAGSRSRIASLRPRWPRCSPA